MPRISTITTFRTFTNFINHSFTTGNTLHRGYLIYRMH